MNIEIKELSKLATSLISYNTVKDLVHKEAFGMAADIIREDIVNIFGGLYLDLNYKIHKSPESLMKQLNFFADAVVGFSVENYMFASSPNHPILQDALKTTLSYVKNPEGAPEADITGCTIQELTDILTFGPFSVAFIKNANVYNTMDLPIPIINDEGLFDSSIEQPNNKDFNLNELFSKPITNQYCINEDKSDSFLTSPIAEYLNYFENHVQCIGVNFGMDGINGGTWYNASEI